MTADGSPVLVEVGARYGLEQPWADLTAAGDITCFLIEPDAEECRRLVGRHARASVVQVALGAATQTQTFFVTRHPGCSSLREPNTPELCRYEIASWFDVVRHQTVDVRRLDELIAAGEVSPPDYLHVDVQGYEAEVLRGAGEWLINIAAMKLELHPVPLYEGEEPMSEVCSWLAELGFAMVAARPQGSFGGDVVEANCFFVNTRAGRTARQLQLVHDFLLHHDMQMSDAPP